jgi:phosphate transport system protein
MAPDTHVAPHFVEELNELQQRLLAMGLLVEDRIRLAMRALVDRDASLTKRVIEGDGEINQFQVEIDDRALKLLALHQPMAVDLRSILAGLKLNTDLERVGDLAVNMAEATERYLSHALVTPILGDIPQMAELAQAMLRDALNSYVSRDTVAAQSVLDRDDALDDLNMKVFRDLLDCMLENAKTIGAALNLILIARHLERVGDHATNIAEDVIFIVAARDVRHLADVRR